MLLYPGALLCRKKFFDFKTFHLKMPSFGRHFCWEKMAAGVFTTGHLELKYFEINEIISA